MQSEQNTVVENEIHGAGGERVVVVDIEARVPLPVLGPRVAPLRVQRGGELICTFLAQSPVLGRVWGCAISAVAATDREGGATSLLWR